VAIAILERKFNESKEEFELILKKAKTFLKKQGIKDNLETMIMNVVFK